MKRTNILYQKIEIEYSIKKRIRVLAFNNDVTERNLVTAICEEVFNDDETLKVVLQKLGVASPKLPKRSDGE